jgi:hypothetical protein
MHSETEFYNQIFLHCMSANVGQAPALQVLSRRAEAPFVREAVI